MINETLRDEVNMKWFQNISTKAKLIFGFGLMILLLGIIIILAYYNMNQLNNSQHLLYNRDLMIIESLLELRSDQNRTRGLMLELTMATNASKHDNIKSKINERTARIDSLLNTIGEQTNNEPGFLSQLSELKSLIEEYRKTREQQYALISERKLKESELLSSGIQSDRFEKIRIIAIKLSNEAKQRAVADLTKNEQSVNSVLKFFVLIGIIAFFLGIGITFSLNKLIANPLQKLSLYANRIASGDLLLEIQSDGRRDEVGQLIQSFEKMTKSLKETANLAQRIASSDLTAGIKPQSDKDILGVAFLKMTENLRRISKELLEGINVLGTSASEILAATTQVASSATESATAVSETSTTVEEVKQTSQIATQKAKYVSDISQKAVQISVTGRKSVEESISGMNKIREQMESIAESTVRLSEQSQAIGEIIATVNDLADQSNLLAVNAAIEAAKAGEQGKGFGVVAQEIKNLAEQSKQATAQVRSILGDVQKAMSSAVMATEQGSKATEAGVKQASEAGESIRVLSEAISEASQSATQIAASSQQQSVGMDQVAIAMENIKIASTQNVAGTKQAELAAQNLNELGRKLKALVEQYKV